MDTTTHFRDQLQDVNYQLEFHSMGPLQRARLLYQQATLLHWLGNPLAAARLARLQRVLRRLVAYDFTHGRALSRIDRNAEEARVGPRCCLACGEEIPSDQFDTVCTPCQQEMLASSTCINCNEPLPRGSSEVCSVECALDALESGL